MMTASSSAPSPVLLPASVAQELMWLIQRASPTSTAYNVTRSRRLVGPLDVAALRRAFDLIVARHEVLRTTLTTVDDRVVQAIHAPAPVPFAEHDLSMLTAEAREAEMARRVRAEADTPIDLERDALMRVVLLRLSPEEHVLVFSSHHVAFDGWSRDVVFRELSEAYAAFVEGREPALPSLPIQYADFAIWQREQLAGPGLEERLAYWRAELGGLSYELDLPTDYPRTTAVGTDAVSESITVEPALRDALVQLGRAHEATLYMVLLAAYATVLHRYAGQDDVLIGSPIAGRAQPETEGLIGYFANTIVQRGRFAGDPTFADVLRRMRESALGAYDHQDVPFEKLAMELQGAASTGRSPIFQVVFTQLDASNAPEARMGPVVLRGIPGDATETKFDLTLFMADRPDGLQLMLRARRSLHRAESVARFLSHLRTVLATVARDPSVHVRAMELRSADEMAQATRWQGPRVDEGRAQTVTALFEAQADRVPGRLAVVGPRPSASAAGSVAGTLPFTYAEVEARANQLAHRLAQLGVARGGRVGMLLDREADAVIALVGVLKAGAACVPLAIEAPAARIAQQVREAEVTVVVTHASLADRVPAGVAVVALDADAAALGALSSARPGVDAAPGDLAYVLFTSGSTGTPKGVAVTHANIVHYARAVSRVLADVPDANTGDGLSALDALQFGLASTMAADLGNTVLYPALLAGGTLHVLSKEVTTEPARYAEYVAVHKLDVLKITPGHLSALAAGRTGRDLREILPRRWLVLGGEALRLPVARMLLGAASCRVLNHYGPTETTVGVCTFEVTAESLAQVESLGAQTVPLGRPLGNTSAMVVGPGNVEQPVGVPGELLIGGDGVTEGYVRRPELTAERFVTVRGARMYRTGDRVRRLADGTIEFLGRGDGQVKIRGYRVELGEVELALAAHPGVAQAVTMIRPDDAGESRLVAYAVPRQAGYAVSHADRPTPDKLNDWLLAQLPAYMVPDAIVLIEAIPLTANGKVDRAKLPAPDAAGVVADQFVAPRTDTEQKLATIWAEVLKKERVGATDNFLTLGGHSLMAIRVLGRISKTFGVRLPLRAIFDHPTVQALAEHLDLERRLAALEAMSDADADALLKGAAPPRGPA